MFDVIWNERDHSKPNFIDWTLPSSQEQRRSHDDGNIYDKEGVYIGTAKDGGEEEEEEDEHPDK